jgi:hypothetical protein
MPKCLSKLVSVMVATIILVMSVSLYSSPFAPFARACSGNCESIINTPTVVVTLNGEKQTINYSLAFSLNNTATGGWHMGISSTQFVTEGTPVHMLPVSASSVTGVTSTCQASQSCTAAPQNVITYPVGVPVTPNSAAFYNAQPGSGIGAFDVTATLALTVPANAYHGIYTNTITLALSVGP